MCHTTPKSKNSRNSGKNCATKTKINDYSSRSHGHSLGNGLVTPGCYSLPVAVPAATEGSGAGGVGAEGTAAEIPPPREDFAAGTTVVAAGTATGIPPPREDVAAGTATGIPPPREDVATAAEVAAAPDEDMGGMPPPRGAADAAGVAAGKPPPREDVAAANGVGAAPDENVGGMPPPRGAADAAGVAAGEPPPREDVAAANGVALRRNRSPPRGTRASASGESLVSPPTRLIAPVHPEGPVLLRPGPLSGASPKYASKFPSSPTTELP